MRGLAIVYRQLRVGLGSIIWCDRRVCYRHGGWRLSFIVVGLVAFAFIIPGAILSRKSPAEVKSPVDNRNTDALQQKTGGVESAAAPGLTLRQAVQTTNFKLLVVVWIFYSSCIFTIMTHMVPHALDLGINPLHAASLVSVIGFATIPGRIGMGIVSDKTGRKPVAVFCALLMALSLILLLFSKNLQTLYIFAVIYGLGYGGLGPPTVALVGDTFGVRHLGTIMGILEIAWVIGASLGPLMAGYIYDSTGTYYLAFIIEVIAAFIVTAVIFFFRTPEAKMINSTGH